MREARCRIPHAASSRQSHTYQRVTLLAPARGLRQRPPECPTPSHGCDSRQTAASAHDHGLNDPLARQVSSLTSLEPAMLASRRRLVSWVRSNHAGCNPFLRSALRGKRLRPNAAVKKNARTGKKALSLLNADRLRRSPIGRPHGFPVVVRYANGFSWPRMRHGPGGKRVVAPIGERGATIGTRDRAGRPQAICSSETAGPTEVCARKPLATTLAARSRFGRRKEDSLALAERQTTSMRIDCQRHHRRR